MEFTFKTSYTKQYTTERTTLIIDGEEFIGIYKWQNRPWQRFGYHTSTYHAIKRALDAGALSEEHHKEFTEILRIGHSHLDIVALASQINKGEK